MSLDGVIAKNSEHFANWTSPEDKKLFVEVSSLHKLIIMGENTFKTFPAPLKNRLNVVFTKNNNLPEVEGVKWVSGDPGQVLKDLATMGYQSALLGGGANLNALFLKHKLISDIIVSIEPKIFGLGLPLFKDDFDIDLELKEMKKLNDNTIMLKYKVLY